MSFNPNMANREVCNLLFVDYLTKKPFLNANFGNVTTSEMTGEPVYAYGGWGHPKRVTFYGDRGGTISLETQIQPFKLYSILTGADITNSCDFIEREVLTATSGSLTLTKTPIAGSVSVFADNDDCGTPLEATVNDTTVTIPSSSTGDFIVYYEAVHDKGVQSLKVKTTTFPKLFIIYAETYNKTEDGEIVPYKIKYYKCSPQPNFSVSYSNSGDPASITLTCDLLGDKDNNLVDMNIIEDDVEDA